MGMASDGAGAGGATGSAGTSPPASVGDGDADDVTGQGNDNDADDPKGGPTYSGAGYPYPVYGGLGFAARPMYSVYEHQHRPHRPDGTARRPKHADTTPEGFGGYTGDIAKQMGGRKVK